MAGYVPKGERVALMDPRRRKVLEFLARHRAAFAADIEDLFFGGAGGVYRYSLDVLESSRLVRRVRFGRTWVASLTGRGAKAVGVAGFRPAKKRLMLPCAVRASAYCALRLSGFGDDEVFDRASVIEKLGLGDRGLNYLWWLLWAERKAALYPFVPAHFEKSLISELPPTDFNVVVCSDPEAASRRCLKKKGADPIRRLFVSPRELRGVGRFLKDPLCWSKDAVEALGVWLQRPAHCVPADGCQGVLMIPELRLLFACGDFRDVHFAKAPLERGWRRLLWVGSEKKASWWLKNAYALCLVPKPPRVLKRGRDGPVLVDASKLKP